MYASLIILLQEVSTSHCMVASFIGLTHMRPYTHTDVMLVKWNEI
jgi:hypothetical protein